jgi:tripartite-type tricarboxylate transporter receptor subunit TctC
LFHLAAVLFQQAAGIKLNEVPYRGAGPAVQGLLGGDVHMMFVDYATARSHIASGTLKALGVAALTPRPELPGVPPVAAVPGLAGFEAWPWQGFVVPAKTPDAVIGKAAQMSNATETPLAQGLALERNLFLKLCITEPALARMRSYEEENITSPSRSIVVEARSVN